MKAGINLSEIGKAVEKTITSYGYKPVDNLTGHNLKRYSLHSGMSVPNVSNTFSRSKPKADDVFAIEPFASNGAGHVISGNGSNIFLCSESVRTKFVRDNKSKMIFNKLKNKFKTLPFAQRWSEKFLSNSDIALRKLAFLGLLKHYPQLIDAKKGIVTQKEHSVIVMEDGCEVIT
jgi:methionyl aminopeptidase